MLHIAAAGSCKSVVTRDDSRQMRMSVQKTKIMVHRHIIIMTRVVMSMMRYGQMILLIILEGEAVKLGSSLSYLDIMLENKAETLHVRPT